MQFARPGFYLALRDFERAEEMILASIYVFIASGVNQVAPLLSIFRMYLRGEILQISSS